MRVIDAVEDFLAYLEVSKPSAHTVKAYRTDLVAVVDVVSQQTGVDAEGLEVSAFDLSTLRRAFALRSRDLAASSLARSHTTWNRFFRFLRSEGIVEVNPMDEIERARIPSSRPKSIDVPDVAARILAAAADPEPKARAVWPARDVAVVALLTTTGLRLAEVVSLDIGSFSGRSGERQLSVVGKGNKTRTIPVSDRLVDLIEGYLKERTERFEGHDLEDSSTPLLVHPVSGRRVTSRQIQYLVERLYRRSGLRSSVPEGALVHALRHTFAMDLLDHGATIIEVQRLLGHASLNTTRRYLDARPDELRNAVASLESVRALGDKGST
ncbi:MAG: tyrosine-type recombinase/integrase [Acidimicrobiia bacterium]|nr:tyrosine-type recombinase/integrase [Acidimicrobiia bacterium]